MKITFAIWLSVIYFIISCKNGNINSNQNKATTKSEIKSDTTFRLSGKLKKTEYDSLKYEYTYSFFNDSLIYTLYMSKGKSSLEYEIPEDIIFYLLIKDKAHVSEIKIQGIANLTSPTESFSDRNKIDEGDYFAADYVFKTKECEIKIRIDVENYEACIVTPTCNDFTNYFKKHPEYDVMKRVKM